MKNAKKSGRRPKEKPTSVERWTIERIDRDAGMVRLEAVPMLPQRVTGALLDSLKKTGPKEGADNLKLWDTLHAKAKRMSIKALVNRLGMRTEEQDRLSENMVFWVVRRAEEAEHEQVFHATQAARQTAKELYKKVTRAEEEQP